MTQRPKIIIECRELGEIWGTKDELNEMDDKAIIELVKEDLGCLLDGARFKVKRIR